MLRLVNAQKPVGVLVHENVQVSAGLVDRQVSLTQFVSYFKYPFNKSPSLLNKMRRNDYHLQMKFRNIVRKMRMPVLLLHQHMNVEF